MPVETVQKFGQDWLELSADRRPKGIEFWIRTVPQVEDYFKTLAANGAADALETFGRNWYPVGGPVKAYRLETPVVGENYTCGEICGNMGIGPKERVNLSFLQFVGISTEAGVKFGISGPLDKESIRGLTKKILTGCHRLFKDHISPIHVELRISAVEI